MKNSPEDHSPHSHYTLYLGCTVPVRALNYEISARKVAERLGVQFSDDPDFSCCGYPVKSVNRYAYLLMAARNLALAEQKGLPVAAPSPKPIMKFRRTRSCENESMTIFRNA
jgi:heterodisulfide reductase subunit B